MAELSEILEAGPVLIGIVDDSSFIVVGAWAFQTENGLAWAPPGFPETPGQSIHFIEGTMEQTGEREWTWTEVGGRRRFELSPALPHFSAELQAEVETWLAYQKRNPETTSRDAARQQIEQSIPEIAGRVLV